MDIHRRVRGGGGKFWETWAELSKHEIEKTLKNNTK